MILNTSHKNFDAFFDDMDLSFAKFSILLSSTVNNKKNLLHDINKNHFKTQFFYIRQLFKNESDKKRMETKQNNFDRNASLKTKNNTWKA